MYMQPDEHNCREHRPTKHSTSSEHRALRTKYQRRWRAKKRAEEIAARLRPKKKKPLTAIERQRRWRARKRKAENRYHGGAVIYGTNADLILAVCQIHLPPTSTVADLTYGKGVFWGKVGPDIRARVTGSDLLTVEGAAFDLRATPYADKSFDVVVIDPPYMHTPGRPNFEGNYRNAETTNGMYHADIRQLYRDGLLEAKRIARRQIWVKCKDEVESGKQCWSHCELLADAEELGLYGRDMFILVSSTYVDRERRLQRHARRPHSYLWVFESLSRASTLPRPSA
jgi:hypothetical protein